MSHTPGPWRWYSRRAIEAREQTVLVGDCGLPSCGRTELFVSDADARLIAAAPDLLAACQDLLKVATSYDYKGGSAARANAAIAKAEGR